MSFWRWLWRREGARPAIPPYRPPIQTHKPPEPGIVVEEMDTSTVDGEALEALRRAQSETGMHRAWKRLTGRE